MRIETINELVGTAPAWVPGDDPEDQAPPREPTEVDTEIQLAEAFSARNPGLRYVALFGHWYQWDSQRWRRDDTLAVFDLARDICRNAAARAGSSKAQATIGSARTVGAVERLARADRAHAATVEQWDADVWLLNTPDGMIDLRTGELRPHDPAACCTKITTVGPARRADCPLWLRFLDRVLQGDPELIRHLQKVAGYALTGITTEHQLWFLYGTGRNGKGVFLNTLTAILGDYAAIAPMETFAASPSERHPTELAMLRGARLVTAQETEEGRQWAESRIKAMTGGDPISARFMRQDFFTFTPQFKLLFAGNHKPGLRNIDEAMRARFNLVPFTVTLPEAERDPELSSKLRAEWPAILRWMIDGCLMWQREGMGRPSAVIEATSEYLEAEDILSTWLGECCISRNREFETSAALFESWQAWAGRAGEAAGSQKRFAEALQSRGFTSTKRHGGVRGFTGIALIRNNYTEEARYGA